MTESRPPAGAMLVFHTNIFALPSEIVPGPAIVLREIELPTWGGPKRRPPLFDRPLAVSFEQIQQQLLELPRMDLEPDGYFLIAGGEAEGNRWQIDGHLHEYHNQMYRVEMHGSCPEAILDRLLSCFGWPDHQLVFELVQEGVLLDEAHFRQWAQRG